MTHRSHLALGGAMFGAALAFTVAADAAPLLDQGKLLLTGGVTNVEGAAGGGIATWATITGYGTNDGIGGNVHATYADVRDYRLTDYGAAVGLYNRVELSYARQDFDMKLSRHMAPLLLATLVAVSAPVCAQTVPAPAPDTTASASNAGATPLAGDAVYKAFHGEEGIQRIMDDFIVRITTDPRIKDRFANANLARLKLLLVQQVSYLIGGPQTYTGRDMKTTHEGMGLQNGDFNALAEDLQLSMDKEGVPFRAQNKLLAKLAPMEHQIVPR